MNTIQKLRALHPEATIFIGPQPNSDDTLIVIEGNITDGITNKEEFQHGRKVNIKLESLNNALEEALEFSLQRLEGCRCLHPGQDDGSNTCWKHHDCNDGSCTHRE